MVAHDARGALGEAMLRLGVVLALASFGLGCGDDDGAPRPDAGGDAGGERDAGAGPVSATDPCLTAGYHFDGKSDCDVMRCPEVSCDCPAASSTVEPPTSVAVRVTGCLQGRGCVDRLDCKRVCDESGRLDREACQQRVTNSGARCTKDEDCVTGRCRNDSAGQLCVDMLGCAADGHCSSGFSCLFSPGSVDEETGVSSSLGSCSDGSAGSTCYANDDCKYHKCSGGRCSGGGDSEPCESDDHCASQFCRITSMSSGSGYCVSGMQGGACADEGDCRPGLHCTSGVCYSSDVGQRCDEASECASAICVTGVCRGGELGSVCEEDAHCKEALCAQGRCASGGISSPCLDTSDCQAGLRCARSVCSDGSAGSPCSVDSDCTGPACVRGSCSAGENGDFCDAPDACKSNRCADPAGVEVGECTSGEPGTRCVSSQNCVSGSCGSQGLCN